MIGQRPKLRTPVQLRFVHDPHGPLPRPLQPTRNAPPTPQKQLPDVIRTLALYEMDAPRSILIGSQRRGTPKLHND